MMKICSIASGSSGNCIYIGDNDTHILIDAGVSRKRIIEGIKSIGIEPEQLNAILVTHEHIDHITGINMMVKEYNVPVYATGGTLDAICAKDKKGIIKYEHLYEVHADKEIMIGSMKIMPFAISHDAAEPVCYTISASGHKASIATDLGMYDNYIIRHLKASEVIMLEANHDVSMVEAGAYPYMLKRRILGEKGHLSNEASGSLLCKLFNQKLKYAVLSHLSEKNNYPALAYEAVKCQIWEDTGIKELPFKLEVAERDKPSALITL